ncbi:hypothetical protein ABZX90_41675 [Streptomyces sp. NPDC002935]|uniref:hypothetical protein n=1 Tax=unclassified Streptomyces TaxID=2593676 RepID=UPI003319782E
MTGDLTVRTTWDGRQADVAARYTGTAQWFTLTGSPAPCQSEQVSRRLHQAVVEAVRAAALSFLSLCGYWNSVPATGAGATVPSLTAPDPGGLSDRPSVVWPVVV